MRIILALLVMWWIVNLIMALASHDSPEIAAGVLYLMACGFGLFVRGAAAGLIGWLVIGIGVESIFYMAYHTEAPPLFLASVLFWSGLAILAGNLFRTE